MHSEKFPPTPPMIAAQHAQQSPTIYIDPIAQAAAVRARRLAQHFALSMPTARLVAELAYSVGGRR